MYVRDQLVTKDVCELDGVWMYASEVERCIEAR